MRPGCLPPRSRLKYSWEGLFTRAAGPEASDNTFFLWEPCSRSHAEVVPGYAHYLLELGFDVSVLLTPARLDEGLFERMHHPRLTLNRIPQAAIVRHFARHGLGRARGILISTARKIGFEDSYRSEHGLFGALAPGQKVLLVEHDVKLPVQRGFLDDHVLTLRPIEHRGVRTRAANPHHFGEFRLRAPRGPTVNFIVVGALRARSRNVDALLAAVGELHREGRRDFHVVFVGEGSLRHVPAELRGYFTVAGRVTFSELYARMEGAHFVLSLLDPRNPDHDFYAGTGTSGHFQLVYGFARPCVVARKFASAHRLTGEDSIVYEDDGRLTDAMRAALTMDDAAYGRMQSALAGLAARIREESLATLREMIGGPWP
jgi:hypothetical protein